MGSRFDISLASSLSLTETISPLMAFHYLVAHPSRRLHTISATGDTLLQSVQVLRVQVNLNEREDTYLTSRISRKR